MITLEQAKEIALRLLTVRARSRGELRAELVKRGADEDIAEQVVERFTEVGLLNDEDFAQQWVQQRRRSKSLSRSMLRRELAEKGVSDEVIEFALVDLEDSEAETALEFARLRVRTMSGLDRDRIMRRLAGQLARRGFSPGIVQRSVMQVISEIGSI